MKDKVYLRFVRERSKLIRYRARSAPDARVSGVNSRDPNKSI